MGDPRLERENEQASASDPSAMIGLALLAIFAAGAVGYAFFYSFRGGRTSTAS